MSAVEETSSTRGSSSRRGQDILYRKAGPGDIEAIAALLFEAGGDTLQFILDELAPGMDAHSLYRYMTALEADQYFYHRCLVAQHGCTIVGMVNAFPADFLRGERGVERSPREAHVMGRNNQIDFSSYLINNLAVLEPYRRRGIATRLIELIAKTARSEGFAALQLQVWADNAHACALYAQSGFVEVSRTEVPWHPALPHEGGRITLERCLVAAAGMTLAADVPEPGTRATDSTRLRALLHA